MIFKACVSDAKFFVMLIHLIERRVAETQTTSYSASVHLVFCDQIYWYIEDASVLFLPFPKHKSNKKCLKIGGSSFFERESKMLSDALLKCIPVPGNTNVSL